MLNRIKDLSRLVFPRRKRALHRFAVIEREKSPTPLRRWVTEVGCDPALVRPQVHGISIRRGHSLSFGYVNQSSETMLELLAFENENDLTDAAPGQGHHGSDPIDFGSFFMNFKIDSGGE